MKTRLFNLWYSFRASSWFVPALMAVVSIGLSFGTVVLDERMAAGGIDSAGWFYTGGPEGARTLLSTVAGSVITVAGVTFSITIVALTLASSQFGPRVLQNFMRDPGNQVTLGTFIATFIYCLLVLRTVRGDAVVAFVPHLSVSIALVFALASLGVLIYFIHHVSILIQADTVIALVSGELAEAITRLFPEELGYGEEQQRPGGGIAELPDEFDRASAAVPATRGGYLQAIDNQGLIKITREHDLILRLKYRPGDFVVQGSVLAMAWPEQRVDEHVGEQIDKAFIVGAHRTLEQDAEFAVNQLVEIAVRALSPGINDPFTAIACVDSLGAALCLLAKRKFPSAYRYDDEGKLRVIADPVTFEGITDAALNQIRQHARTSVAVTIRLLETITLIAGHTRTEDQRRALLRHATMIERGSREAIPEEGDRRDIQQRYRAVVKALEKP